MGAPSLGELLQAQPQSPWANMNSSVDSLRNYLAQQQGLHQQLQMQNAMDIAKARSEVWSKMQDPIARALTMGNLAKMGYPIDQMNAAMGQGGMDIGQMLQGNPFAKDIGMGSNQGAFMGNSMPSMGQSPDASNGTPQPMGGQAANFNSLNPVGGSAPSTGDLVQEQVKMSPFGTPLPAEYTNLPAVAQKSATSSYATQIGTAKAQQTTGTTMLDSITRNLAADLKAHFIESGGGGPIKGTITGLSTKLGMSPATYGLQNTVRDSAIAYARDLAGGSQGVQRLFQSIGETIPQVGTTEDQSGTALLQMHLTAAQLQKGMQNLGLQPKDLANMNDEEIQKVLASGSIDRDAETQRFANLMSTIKPTKIMGMNGKLSEPTLNPILNMFSGKKQQNGTPSGNSNMTLGNQPSSSVPTSNNSRENIPSREQIIAELQRRQAAKAK